MSGPYGIHDCFDLCLDCWELAEEMVPSEYREAHDRRLCDQCFAEWEKDRLAEESTAKESSP